MNAREMLEMAAKAAGYKAVWMPEYDADDNEIGGCFCIDGNEWSSLTDDGDALRMAVKLYMFDYDRLKQLRIEETRKDPSRDDCTIMRLAITRAAAELGRNMP